MEVFQPQQRVPPQCSRLFFLLDKPDRFDNHVGRVLCDEGAVSVSLLGTFSTM